MAFRDGSTIKAASAIDADAVGWVLATNILVSGAIAVPSGDVNVIPVFFVKEGALDTLTVTALRYKIGSGTSATFKLQKNGGDVTGATGIAATTTSATTTLGTPASLADLDELQIIVTAVSGAPQNLSVAVIYSRT
jgi:hypothetical protein